MKNLSNLIGILFVFLCAASAQAQSPQQKTWQFAFSGDSRNCGDVVMPSIAQDIAKTRAEFYWHLGDLRAISDYDEDIINRAGMTRRPSIAEYERTVWQDMIENQIDRFGLPFYLGIGNHESMSPKTRADYLIQFADWLELPALREQRLKDDPNDHKLRAYFHWQKDGVDFIYLDNATTDQFDAAQLAWFNKVMNLADADPNIKTVVVGMHEALPDSLSFDHSMSDYPSGTETGRLVYKRLLKSRNEAHKTIYVLASHSHFVMDNIFASDYWKANGGVLPGWIVGTAGAVRYALPKEAQKYSQIARTNVYGYMLATVNPPGQPAGSIKFDFHEIKVQDVPADVRTKFGDQLVKWCFEKNSNVP
jgi:hypothetical protein